MKTLHVHIGTPKTGTTALQNFCGENGEALSRRGYCYPRLPFEYPGIPKVRNAHFMIANLFDENGERQEGDEERRFLEGMWEIRRLFSKFDHVILSDEDIWKCMDSNRKNLWERLKDEADQAGYRIHVVVYLRRQDDLLSSIYNQRIKNRRADLYESSFEEFSEKIDLNIRLRYYEKLKRIADVIGKENLTARRYESRSGEAIYSDFLDAVGIAERNDFSISQADRNPGLYGNTQEIKRVLNGLPGMEDRKAHDFIMEMLLGFSNVSKQAYPCQMFSKEEAQEFLKTYEEGNRRVAQEFLNEPELFDPNVSDEPKWQKDNPYLVDDVVRLLGSSILHFYQENQAMKKELKELKQELRAFRYKVKHPVAGALGIIKRKAGGLRS